MLDHVSFSVNNYKQSLKFYDETLKILGIERLRTFETGDHNVAGYGFNGKPFFWIGESASPDLMEFVGKARGFHIAFRALDIQTIYDWYQKCLELGGMDNGAPGPRPEYHPGYYGAFIIDPNGWRIEAALHNYIPA
jgi:catechol 2,3-dioxygenase-like lactoylglutathione lyase family enzyme